MARYQDGVFGPFSGKVGHVVGSSWRGIDCLRSLPRPSNKPATLAQLSQRLRMAVATGWLQPISDWLNIGYGYAKEGKTPLNAAVSLHMKYAIQGTGMDLNIDIPKAVLSVGELLPPSMPQIDRSTAESGLEMSPLLTFSWQNDWPCYYAQDDDQAVLIVYNSVKEQFVILEQAALRSALTAILELPSDYMDDTLYCWQVFISAEGERVSTSVYLGMV